MEFLTQKLFETCNFTEPMLHCQIDSLDLYYLNN